MAYKYSLPPFFHFQRNLLLMDHWLSYRHQLINFHVQNLYRNPNRLPSGNSLLLWKAFKKPSGRSGYGMKRSKIGLIDGEEMGKIKRSSKLGLRKYLLMLVSSFISCPNPFDLLTFGKKYQTLIMTHEKLLERLGLREYLKTRRNANRTSLVQLAVLVKNEKRILKRLWQLQK